MENTGSHYFLVACDPETTLATWYEKLHKHMGVSTAQAKEKAREAYKIVILKLKNPKDWKKWLKAWEEAMAKAQKKEVPETLSELL